MKALILPLLAVVGLCGFRSHAPEPLGPVRLSVVDRDTGQPLDTWRHHNQRWVAGERDKPYALRIRNHGSQRVLVVLSVDGLNVITGAPAAPDQTGYILGPGQSADITGWRKSDDDVARFVFSPPDESYASRTGQGGNLGVIGMAVIAEAARLEIAPAREPARPSAASPSTLPPMSPSPPAPASRMADNAAAEASSTSVRRSVARERASLGTAHGDRETSIIRRVAFQRAPGPPLQIQQMRYDSLQALVAKGIAPRSALVAQGPRAFPGTEGSDYAPDPPPRR